MKRHIKKIITVALCMSIMQPTLQATPFGEFTRKWAARGAAVVYWGLLSLPGSRVIGSFASTDKLCQDLKGVDKDGNECFPDLKKNKMYAELDAIVRREGLPSLDSQTIRVFNTRDIKALDNNKTSLEALFALKRYPFTLPNGTIIVPDSFLESFPSDQVAAALLHEGVHADKDHSKKRALAGVVMPFALHGLYRAVRPLKAQPGVYPSITRSLMRIPGAVVIGVMVTALSQRYSQEQEIQADAGVKESTHLSRAAASFFKSFKPDEDRLEKLTEDIWSRANDGLSTNPLDDILARNMGKKQYVAVVKKIHGLTSDHSWPSERIKYLEQWAEEAEAKKQQASAKED